MNKTEDERITYLFEDHIFQVDVSGKINLSKITEISRALRDCIKSNLTANKAIKFLFDFRNVQWDSEETHMKAREISGKYLHDVLSGKIYFSAILNDRVERQSSENEFFFRREQNALDWLRSK